MPRPIDPITKINVVLGTFNVGLDQAMLRGRNQGSHIKNFRQVCSKAIDANNLDCFFSCEVGGHRQGFQSAGIDIEDVMHGVLPLTFNCEETQNYLSVWNTRGGIPEAAGASQPGDPSTRGPSLSILVRTQVIRLFGGAVAVVVYSCTLYVLM